MKTTVCHKKTSVHPLFSYFTLAGNSEGRLMDLIYKLKTTFVTCTIELDSWTSNRSNLCFDFAVLQAGPRPSFEKTYGGFPRNRTNFTPRWESSVGDFAFCWPDFKREFLSSNRSLKKHWFIMRGWFQFGINPLNSSWVRIQNVGNPILDTKHRSVWDMSKFASGSKNCEKLERS